MLSTANLRTKILDFRGFDSGRILILRGGILRSTGGFPESLSRAVLVGILFIRRLCVITTIEITLLMITITIQITIMITIILAITTITDTGII